MSDALTLLLQKALDNAWDTLRKERAEGYRAGLEKAAKLIEDHCIAYGGGEPRLEPRRNGDTLGFPYVVAIRSLMEKTDAPE